MATKTINTFTAASIDGTDEILFWDTGAGTTRKITWANALTNATLVTPTIASFANATHNHSNAAGGGVLTGYLLATGATTGATSQAQTFTNGINGSTSANGDLSIRGTSNATKTTSYVLLQQDGGYVGIGTTSPTGPLAVAFASANSASTPYDATPSLDLINTDVSGVGNHIPLRFNIGAGEYIVIDAVRVADDQPELRFGYRHSGSGGWVETARITYRGRLGLGSSAPSTLLDVADTNSGTSAVQNALTLRSTNSGTPAAGFGVGLRAGLKSSTTADQDAGRLTWAWATATHASRAAQGKLTAYYTSSEREAITWTADSAGVKVGIGTSTVTHVLTVNGGDSAANAIALTTSGYTSIPNPGSTADSVLLSPRGFTMSTDSATLGASYQPTLGIGVAMGRAAPAIAIKNSAGPALVTEAGNVGLGVASPQAILHAHDGSGGFMFINRSGVSSTLVTVIPDGAGDVTENISYFGWCSNSAGVTFQIGDGYQAVSSSTTKTDGANTLTFAVTAAGAFTLQTTLGTATWKVCIWAFWR